MIAATLFSGIGAPETAMPHWQWPWHAEIKKFPSAVMAQRHSDSINLGDVTVHDFSEKAATIARPDILIFGSPCQSFSIAGKRLGMDDPRGNLALCALGIVGRLAPDWFVFENVPGLLSSAEGQDFGLFLRTVDELGYSLAWTMLDAQYFGVAQRRKRLFAVGHIGDWRGPAAVLFEPEGLCGYHPPRREAGESIAQTIAARTRGGGGLGTDFDCDGGLIVSTGDISHCLNAGGMGRIDYETETFISIPSDSTVRRLTPRECERLQGFPDDYTVIIYRNKPAAEGPRYKALGNSMAVPVMRWILTRIEMIE
jgi:DNA (cytosine-5)-methyltransferase 1